MPVRAERGREGEEVEAGERAGELKGEGRQERGLL